MGKIKEIVNVVITRETLNITQAGFGTALVLVESTALGNRVEAFAESAELIADDRFGINNIAYKAGLALLGQDQKPAQFKVGMKGTTARNCRQRIKLDALATAGTFTVSYNGEVSSAIAFDATEATIETAIGALVDITSVDVTGTADASTELTIEFDGDAGIMFEDLVVDITNLTGPSTVTVTFGHKMVFPLALAALEIATITVTVDGTSEAAAVTAPVTATTIKTAIEALTVVGSGNCAVIEDLTQKEYVVIFKGDLYGKTTTVAAVGSVAGAAEVTAWYQGQALEDWSKALNDCLAEDSDWFALTTPELHTSADYADQLAMAAIIEAEDYKIYSIKSSDTAIITTDYDATAPSDIAEGLKANSYDKSFVTYQKSTKALTQFPDCAILGRQLTRTPGSSTYNMKTLKGITVDSFSTSQKNSLKAKNCNFYEAFNGKNIFREGKVGSGEFIDVIVGIDYVGTRMGELIFGKVSAVEKLSYTQSGITVVESLVRTSLKLYGVDTTIIEESTIVIEVPDVTTVDPADKASRTLRHVKWTAQLQGAIHTIYISGKVYA